MSRRKPDVSKPCARVGCTVVITGPSYRVKKRTYCSPVCAAQGKLAGGWTPHAYLTPALRARGAQRGGTISGRRRRLASLAQAVASCEVFLTVAFVEGLSVTQLARIKVLMGRAYLKGRKCGAHASASDRRDWQKKGKAAA